MKKIAKNGMALGDFLEFIRSCGADVRECHVRDGEFSSAKIILEVCLPKYAGNRSHELRSKTMRINNKSKK